VSLEPAPSCTISMWCSHLHFHQQSRTFKRKRQLVATCGILPSRANQKSINQAREGWLMPRHGSLFLPSRLLLRYCSSGFCGLLASGGRLQAQAFKLQALKPSISALKPFIAALQLQPPRGDRKPYPKTIASHCKPPQAPTSPLANHACLHKASSQRLAPGTLSSASFPWNLFHCLERPSSPASSSSTPAHMSSGAFIHV
jgi:hypothetical protein